MAESSNRRQQIADESIVNQTIGMDESMERSLQFSTSQNPVIKKKDQQGSATLPDIKDPKNKKQKMRINPRDQTDKKSPSVRTQKKGLSFFDTTKLLDPDMYEDSDLDITLTDFAKFKGWMSQKPAKKVHKLQPMSEAKPAQETSTDVKPRIAPPATKFVANEPKRATSVGRPSADESRPKVLPFPLDGTQSGTADSKTGGWVSRPEPQKQSAAPVAKTDNQPNRSQMPRQLLDRYVDPMAPRAPMVVAQPTAAPPLLREEEPPAFRAVANNSLPVEKNVREHMVSRYSQNGRSGLNITGGKSTEAVAGNTTHGSRVGFFDKKLPKNSKPGDSRTKISNEWLFGRENTEDADPSRDRSYVAGPPQEPRKETFRYRVLDDFAGNWSPRNRIDMLYSRENESDPNRESTGQQRSPLSRYYLQTTPEATGGEYAFSVFNKTKTAPREQSQDETDRQSQFDNRNFVKGILGRFVYQNAIDGAEFQEDIQDGLQDDKERIPQPEPLENYGRDEFDEESDCDMKAAAEKRKKMVVEVAKLLHVDEIIRERQLLDSMRLQLLEERTRLKSDQRNLEMERTKLLGPPEPEPEPVVSPRSGWVTQYEPKPRIPVPKLTKTGKPVVSFAGFGKHDSGRYEKEFFLEEISRKSEDFADDDNSSDLGELEFEKYLIKFEELEELRRERAARRKARESLQKAQMKEQLDSQISSRKPSLHGKATRDGDSNPAFNNSINKSLKVDSDARLDENAVHQKLPNTSERINLKEPEQILNVEEHNVSFNRSFKYLLVDTMPINPHTGSKTSQKSRITLKPLETPLLDQYAYAEVNENNSKKGSPHNASKAYLEAFAPNIKNQSPSKRIRSQDDDEQPKAVGSKSILDPGSPVFVPILAALEPIEDPQQTIPDTKRDRPKRMFSSEPHFYPEDPKVTINSIKFKKNTKKRSTDEPILEDFEELVITPEMISTPPPTVEVIQGNRIYDSDLHSMSKKNSNAPQIMSHLQEQQQPLPPIQFVAKEESRPAQPIPQRPVRLPAPVLRHNSVNYAPERSGPDRRLESVRGENTNLDDGIRPPRVSSSNLQGRASEANRLNESTISSASRNQAVRSPHRIVMSKNQFMKNRANTHKRIPITDGDFLEARPTNTDLVTFSPPQLPRTLQSHKA